jgi:hypothetical protein
MGARILAFDISTCTGYAFWDSSRDVSSIEAGVIELPEPKKIALSGKHDYSWDDWRVAQVGPKVSNLIKRFSPDFILNEERLRFSKTGDSSFAMSNAIHGAVYSHCCSWGLLFGTISVQSWRKAAYGEGYKQPLVPDLDRSGLQKTDKKTGRPALKAKDWGDIAVEKCEQLNIQLPTKKSIAHNAAEAAIISMMWRCHKRISIPADRDHERYIELLQRAKSSRSAEMAA